MHFRDPRGNDGDNLCEESGAEVVEVVVKMAECDLQLFFVSPGGRSGILAGAHSRVSDGYREILKGKRFFISPPPGLLKRIGKLATDTYT